MFNIGEGWKLVYKFKAGEKSWESDIINRSENVYVVNLLIEGAIIWIKKKS